MNVFVDTNTLLDVLGQREPFYAAAATVWSLAETGRVRASVSAISFNNVYYIVRKAAGEAKALEALRLLRGVFDVVAVDARLLDQAIDSGIRDFEDAIQYFSALRVRARYLITRDPGGFPDEGPAIVSADEFAASVKPSQ